MGFQFQWNKDKTVMIYKAVGDWNWKDYYTVVRSSLFWMQQQKDDDGVVDVLVDFSESTRAKLPAGIQAHIRAFTRQQHQRMSGRVVVLAFPAEGEQSLEVDESRQLHTTDGVIQFVDTLNEAIVVFRQWRQAE